MGELGAKMAPDVTCLISTELYSVDTPMSSNHSQWHRDPDAQNPFVLSERITVSNWCY